MTAGTLPPGMFLGWDGNLTGTPAAGGTYTFTVATIDADGCRSARTYQLFVSKKRYAVGHR